MEHRNIFIIVCIILILLALSGIAFNIYSGSSPEPIQIIAGQEMKTETATTYETEKTEWKDLSKMTTK